MLPVFPQVCKTEMELLFLHLGSERLIAIMFCSCTVVPREADILCVFLSCVTLYMLKTMPVNILAVKMLFSLVIASNLAPSNKMYRLEEYLRESSYVILVCGSPKSPVAIEVAK